MYHFFSNRPFSSVRLLRNAVAFLAVVPMILCPGILCDCGCCNTCAAAEPTQTVAETAATPSQPLPGSCCCQKSRCEKTTAPPSEKSPAHTPKPSCGCTQPNSNDGPCRCAISGSGTQYLASEKVLNKNLLQVFQGSESPIASAEPFAENIACAFFSLPPQRLYLLHCVLRN